MKAVPKSQRQIGKIYANVDEMGNVLTYSVLTKIGGPNGMVIEIERNTRRELEPFLKKYDYLR